MQINATIITIGDELLIGQTIDTNSAWLGVELNKIGVWVRQRMAVGDVQQHIVQALDIAIAQSEIVIITGGLGPTADDITKPLLCNYFGGRMIQNDAVEKHVRQFFEKRKRPILDVNIKQAQVPDVCQVLWNTYGTAPGMLFTKGDKLIFALPGVPLEMKNIMQTSGVEHITQQFTLPSVQHRTLCTAGKGESFIAVLLQDFEKTLPTHIKLAYLPALGQVKLRLTSIDGTIVELQEFFAALHQRLAHITYALKDTTLQEVIIQKMSEAHLTLSCAESCTGGYISHLLTNIAGCSSVLCGSIVPYTNAVKTTVLGITDSVLAQHGAVSEYTAIQLACNAQTVFCSDFAISTTGYLDAGTNHEAEIWICVASQNATKTIHHTLPYHRERNKELASNYALLLLWRAINEATAPTPSL